MNNFRKFALVSLAATVTAAILFSEADAQTGVKRKKKGPPDYCSTQYDPVCARTVQGILTTFNNECSAHKGGAAVIAKSKCDKVKCPPAELTVCARKDGKNGDFTDACVAEKEGAAVLLRDNCPEKCSEAGPAVCAVDDKGKRAEFKNACQAVLVGARVLHDGKCVAGAGPCTTGGRRGCAIAPNGLETQYANQCLAETANAAWLHNGKCEPGVFTRLIQRYRG